MAIQLLIALALLGLLVGLSQHVIRIHHVILIDYTIKDCQRDEAGGTGDIERSVCRLLFADSQGARYPRNIQC